MLEEIQKTWKTGRWDATARNELVRTLREVSELDAGQAVIDLLKHGVSTTPQLASSAHAVPVQHQALTGPQARKHLDATTGTGARLFSSGR